MITDAEVLLAGPRGRRLCLELVMEMSSEIRSAAFWLAHDLDPGKGTSRVILTAVSDAAEDPLPTPSMADFVTAVGSLDVARVDGELLDRALAQAVNTSRPWQEPDGEDVLAGLPEVRTSLAPVARRLVALPSTQWWAQGRQIEQWAIDWRSPDDRAPLGRNPAQLLSTWARAARVEEVRAEKERPRDPGAFWSGTWWSIPDGALQSVGRIPLGLNLIEDSFGWEHATTIPLRGIGRTYEIRGEDDWVSLCRAYPLEVTASRRHDWFRCTGRDGAWLIPDWEKAAQQWDTVHLTALAYLGSANRALQVDVDTATVIAGWNPDTTIWLTDSAQEWDGARRQWRRPTYQDLWENVDD